jgi:hypothetical protein
MRRTLVAAVAAAAAAASLGGCSQDSRVTTSGGDAQCAALLEYDGHRYTGHGELKRDPDTTGRVESATALGCDDGNGVAPDRQVEAAELADVPVDRALLVQGTLYVRVDRPLPEAARAWFVPPACDRDGAFELRGDWLSVKGMHEPGFDGDLRPPYRVVVHVDDGPPKYVGTTIAIRATADTDPSLGPKDVKGSLWEGGGLTAQVHCVGGGFVATGLTSTPG